MSILLQKQSTDLLAFLPKIKSSLKEWLFVEIRLTEKCDKDFGVEQATQLIATLFEDRQGALFVCNHNEILLLVRMPQTFPYTPADVSRKIEKNLPAGSCEAHAYEPTPSGIKKLEILISYHKSQVTGTFSEIRRNRTAPVALIADDDLYMRTLIKKCIPPGILVYEVADGKDVMNSYTEHVPNILFLDIHLPNLNGKELLRNILAVDPAAFIIMQSADSSIENVKNTKSMGAKGFLAKPFTRDKILEHLQKCPGILHA